MLRTILTLAIIGLIYTSNAYAVEAQDVDQILMSSSVEKADQLNPHIKILNLDVEVVLFPEKKIMGWQSNRWTSNVSYQPIERTRSEFSHYPNKPESDLLYLKW